MVQLIINNQQVKLWLVGVHSTRHHLVQRFSLPQIYLLILRMPTIVSSPLDLLPVFCRLAILYFVCGAGFDQISYLKRSLMIRYRKSRATCLLSQRLTKFTVIGFIVVSSSFRGMLSLRAISYESFRKCVIFSKNTIVKTLGVLDVFSSFVLMKIHNKWVKAIYRSLNLYHRCLLSTL